jgi:hypothetical protein
MNPRKLIKFLVISLAALAATGLNCNVEGISSVGPAFANPINLTLDIE